MIEKNLSLLCLNLQNLLPYDMTILRQIGEELEKKRSIHGKN